MPVLSIIVPAYNEEKTLETLIHKVLQVQLPLDYQKEIIICNDCSRDRTEEIASRLAAKYSEIKVLSNDRNLGKSQTVRRGIMESTGDYVIIQDADLEYDPEDFAVMLAELHRHRCDVGYGNRFGKDNGVVYVHNFVGNLFLSFISSIFTSFRLHVVIPDMEVCYKMIPGQVARELASRITSTSNFGFEPEITARLSRYKKADGSRLKFLVMPVSYYPRTIEEGKKIRAVRDGLKALAEIFRYNLF